MKVKKIHFQIWGELCPQQSYLPLLAGALLLSTVLEISFTPTSNWSSSCVTRSRICLSSFLTVASWGLLCPDTDCLCPLTETMLEIIWVFSLFFIILFLSCYISFIILFFSFSFLFSNKFKHLNMLIDDYSSKKWSIWFLQFKTIIFLNNHSKWFLLLL